MLTTAQKEKNKKKGDGINAVLVLMKDIREFQDRVEECADAQSLMAHKKTILGFNKQIESMYNALLDIAKGGIKTNISETSNIEIKNKPEIMLNTPTIPSGLF